MNAEQRRQLLDTYDIPVEMLDRLIGDIWALTVRTPEEWVQRRHMELQQEGKRNEEIFATLKAELPNRRFAAKPATLRQIRRMIYG